MMRRTHQSRWLLAAGALAAGTALTVGCFDAKKELLEPQNPSIIGPDQVNSPTAADALRKGVVNRLKSAFAGADGTWDDGGLMADEWKSANTLFQHQELDSRSLALNNGQVSSVYNGLQSARGAAYTAIASLNQYLPTPLYLAQMYLVLGFAEVTEAAHF